MEMLLATKEDCEHCSRCPVMGVVSRNELSPSRLQGQTLGLRPSRSGAAADVQPDSFGLWEVVGIVLDLLQNAV